MDDILVKAVELRKKYGSFEALQGLNLNVPSGKIFGLLGPNGSGKTTLIKIMAGLLTANGGEVFIEGGKIVLDVAAHDTKGIKSDAQMTISGGTITGTVSGNGTKGISVDGDLTIKGVANNPLIDLKVTGTTYAAGTADESKCRGIKGKGDFIFDGGTIKISATGAKSKAISIDGTYTYKSGSLNCAVDAAN